MYSIYVQFAWQTEDKSYLCNRILLSFVKYKEYRSLLPFCQLDCNPKVEDKECFGARWVLAFQRSGSARDEYGVSALPNILLMFGGALPGCDVCG